MDENLKAKYEELANLIFPDVIETVEDLEKRYPERNLKEGACVTRFAPSPTGFFHTGSLFTSLIDKKLASQTEGIFYLRIEDTDRKREVKDSVKDLTSQMKEFGIVPDEGVISESEEIGEYGPYTQSKRADIYRICAKHLVLKGLAYPCFCTPEMLQKTHDYQEEHKIVPGYYSVYAKCRNISVDEYIERIKNGEKYILRFRSNGSHLKKVSFKDGIKGKIEIAQNDQDVVIIKSDGLPTYHFAHVCDDHFMRTTHVIRGEEWVSSVPIHLELFYAMGFKAPVYVHLPSIMKMDGTSKRKLSKRKDNEAAVAYFLKAGYPIESVIEYLLTIINSDFENWKRANKMVSNDEFEMKLKKINTSGALFDNVKLNDVSKEVISRMNSDEVLNAVLEWAKEYNEEVYSVISKDLAYSKKIFALERDGAKKIRKDIYKWEDIMATFFYFFDEYYENDIKDGYDFKVENKLTKEVISNVLESYIKIYDENNNKDEWFSNMKDLADKLRFCTNMKEYKENPDNFVGSIADFSDIIRIAITNRHNTPDIYSIMQILGKDRVISRLEKAKESIN